MSSRPLMSLSLMPAAAVPTSQLESLRTRLTSADEAETLRITGPIHFDHLLKSTVSLCPQCLAHVPAIVYTLGGRVLMHKRCDVHGESDAVIENDEHYYHLSSKDRWGRRFADAGVIDIPAYNTANGGDCCGPSGCGDDKSDAEAAAFTDFTGDFADQMSNKSCTVLVEVTNACNLACPVCYSDAHGDRGLPLADFKRYMLRLIDAKDGLDSVQLTGGEAVLHPEFWQMVRFLHDQSRVKKIYLPTNGIAFADPAVAAKLEPFRDRLMVLLQFDGQTQSNQALRAANPQKIRQRVIENLAQLDIQMQLTMTITRGVNDGEIGWVVDTGMKHANVKVIAMQPVTYSGRYDLTQDPMQRLTLSDVVKAVAAQVRRRTDAADFAPIPCSHPNCGWITLYVRRMGLTLNIARYVDLDKAMNRAANRTLLKTDELRSIIGGGGGMVRRIGAWAGRKLIRSTDVFGIAIKPFMDRYNYDQDRISACCHHLLDTHGRPVSFCEYNARVRQSDPWDALPRITAAAESAQ